jgi:hypothetical protein
MTAVYCCCLSERTTAQDAGRRQMKYPSQSKLSSLLEKNLSQEGSELEFLKSLLGLGTEEE